MMPRSPNSPSPRALALLLALTAAVLLQLAWTVAAGEVVTRQAIVRQLAAPRDEHRGLVPVEDAAAAPASPARSIELTHITFELDSSELTAAARAQLDELIAALASDELRGFRFQIIGHTDARGTREYNQTLSERRAGAVLDYLVRVGGLAPRRFEALGRGRDAPSRPDDPWAAANRRVEVRNVGADR